MANALFIVHYIVIRGEEFRQNQWVYPAFTLDSERDLAGSDGGFVKVN